MQISKVSADCDYLKVIILCGDLVIFAAVLMTILNTSRAVAAAIIVEGGRGHSSGHQRRGGRDG